jgi:hypothetical protein
METTITTSGVAAITAADPAHALAHFSSLLSVETDCWDVHDALPTAHKTLFCYKRRRPLSHSRKTTSMEQSTFTIRTSTRQPLRNGPKIRCSLCTALARTATEQIAAQQPLPAMDAE